MEVPMSLSAEKVLRIKRIVAVLAVGLGIAIALMDPPQGLTRQAMIALGIVVWAVFWWITQVVPEYVTAIMMCTLWAGTKCVSFRVAFDSFSSPGWWIMVGAFGLGSIAGKTGLLRRISLWVLSLFPPTFNGQVLGLLASGTVISPLVPSMNAKAALSSPISLAISDSLGVERKSPAASGLLGACYGGFVLMGHMFLSGSFSHYIMIGALPAPYNQITWLDWMLWSLPWGVVCFAALAGFIMLLYRPKQPVSLPKGYGKEQLAKLGPMTRDERIVLAVMLCALVLWMTELVHGISASVVAVTAMCVLLGLKVMTAKDFKNGIEWPAVMLIGCVFNMAPVIKALGIDKYLGGIFGSVIAGLAAQPALFVTAIAVSIFIVKFLVTNMTSAAIMFSLILTPIAVQAGIHPWIIIFVAFCAGNIWLLKYQNTIYLCAQFATKGEMSDHLPMVKLCFVFMGVVIVGSIVSIPYWRMLGLLP
jgi:DASS family divalent anion:Na+ symporter